MKRRTTKRFWEIKIAILVALAAASMSAAVLELRITLPRIPAGSKAEIQGRATARTAVVVTVAGPAMVAGATVNAGADGSFTAEIGPFSTPGDYQVTAVAGVERKTAPVQVTAPTYAMSEPQGSLGEALANAADATDQALAAVKSGLDAISGGDGNIKKAKDDVDRVREKIPELRNGFRQFTRAEASFEQTLLCEPNLDRDSMREYGQFLSSTEQSLHQQTEQLIALGREASGGQTDACVGVALAGQALKAEQAVLEIMQSGLRDYLADWTQTAGLDAAESLPSWIPRIRDRFLNGMRSVFEGSSEDQVLNRTAAPGSDSVVSRWTICRSLLDVGKGFLEGGPWGAAKAAIEDAVDIALDAYTETHCLVFIGKMSGHTHVEASDNGRPMYGLDNDWEGTARITGAKPEGTNPAAFRGILTGRAKNFAVANFLRSLYADKPGNFQFLTGKPSTTQRLGAVFAVPLEGTLAGGKMALKARKGGIDFDGRVIAKLAVVVIPTGSSVPLVQKYDTPFQPGWWQVTRALGDGGMTTLDVVMDGDKRVVKKEWTRSLTNAGAKGTFKIKVDLCGGCGD